jgi:hypothetical protein
MNGRSPIGVIRNAIQVLNFSPSSQQYLPPCGSRPKTVGTNIPYSQPPFHCALPATKKWPGHYRDIRRTILQRYMLALRADEYINRYEIDIHPLSMVNLNGKITFEPSQPQNQANIQARSDLFPVFITASYSKALLIELAKKNALWAGLLILMFYIGSHYLCWSVFGSKRYFIQQVQKAIQNKQFEPFYQPIVNTTGIASGAEVLIRWRHPAQGLIFPDQFIAAADRLNLLTPIMQS